MNLNLYQKGKPSNVMNKEYNYFYNTQLNNHENSLSKIHFNAKSNILFSSVLFIPKRSLSNVFQLNNSSNN